jgi:hypothetical protein
VQHLFVHLDAFKNWDNPAYYNLEYFKTLEIASSGSSRTATGAVVS